MAFPQIPLRRLRFLPDPTSGDRTFVSDILRKETVGGAIALLAAAVAVIWANTLGHSYEDLRH